MEAFGWLSDKALWINSIFWNHYMYSLFAHKAGRRGLGEEMGERTKAGGKRGTSFRVCLLLQSLGRVAALLLLLSCEDEVYHVGILEEFLGELLDVLGSDGRKHLFQVLRVVEVDARLVVGN